MEHYEALNKPPNPEETETEKNKRESTQMLFNPERFIKNKLFRETSPDVLTNASKLTAFIQEVQKGSRP
jgi:hypothetical protein